MFRLDPNSGELKNYIHDPADLSTLADNAIRSSGEDREGNFWVATSRTLDEFDKKTGKVKRHIPVGESGVGLWFHEDRFGVFWVICGSLGQIATLDRKTKSADALRIRMGNGTSARKSGVFHARRQQRNYVVWKRCRRFDEVRSTEALLYQLPSRPGRPGDN